MYVVTWNYSISRQRQHYTNIFVKPSKHYDEFIQVTTTQKLKIIFVLMRARVYNYSVQ